MPVTYPVINGIRYDFSSVEISILGKRFPGVKSLNYKQSLNPGMVRGTAAQVLGRTRGQYDAEGDMELYREDADDFLTLIQATQPAMGILEIAFDLNINFFEPIAGAVPSAQNDRVIGARLKEDSASQAQSADPLVVRYSFHALMLVRNGRFPVGIPQAIGVRL